VWKSGGLGALEKDAARAGPIPKRLWAAAAAVAREHGINPTSKALHLEFKGLKEFVQSARATKRTVPPTPQFVELMTPPTVSECVIELEGRHGKMRIQWRGMTAADLAQLSRMIIEQTRFRSRRR